MNVAFNRTIFFGPASWGTVTKLLSIAWTAKQNFILFLQVFEAGVASERPEIGSLAAPTLQALGKLSDISTLICLL